MLFSFSVDIALSETRLEYMYAIDSESEILVSLLLCLCTTPFQCDCQRDVDF